MATGIHSYLDVWIGHISMEDARKLQHDTDLQHHSMIVYPYDMGYFIVTTPSIKNFAEKEEMSKGFMQILELAQKHRCNLIQIDRDGTIHTELPSYVWD